MFFFVIAFEIQQQLQSFQMILCDETSSRVIRLLPDNLRQEQHLVLFTAEKGRNVDPQFDQFLLRTCLRSTSQLARFANTYHLRQLESFSVHIASPSKTFHGEHPDIRWADENSNENDFLQKSIDTILELVAEPGLDFAVVPLLQNDLLQRILDTLSGNHLCNVDQTLVEKKGSHRHIRSTSSKSDGILRKYWILRKEALKLIKFFRMKISVRVENVH